MNSPTRTIVPAPVRKTIHVNAPQERAFRVFTAGMATWWKPGHHIAATPFTDIVIEPRSGGRWLERDKDGAECVWGKVILWEPPARLILGWQLDADWRFDADFLTEVEVRFIAEGATATRVELEHRNIEKYGAEAEAVRAALDSADGWNGLLALFTAAAAKG